MSQALYRKWRPQSWEAVIGQQHVIQTLRNALAGGRIAHAYLFAGPRGTGKTTTARLLAKAVNCLEDDLALRPCGKCAHCQAVNQGHFLDLIEIDAASNTSVEDVRDLRDKINFSPNQGRYKVYIIDEVHMLSSAAFNALLKTLEEPPPHAIFVLATTEVHKIPATVLSRCQRHEFRRIPVVEIIGCLKEICSQEDIQASEEALVMIARHSTGAMRDAISLVDQLASTGKPISLELVQDVLGTATSLAVSEMLQALIERKADQGLDCIHAALDAGCDPRQFSRQVVDYLRDLLLVSMGNAGQVEAGAEIKAQMAQHAQAFTPLELLRLIRVFNGAANEGRGAWLPALPLEMAFIEALQPGAEPEQQPSAPAAPAGRPAEKEAILFQRAPTPVVPKAAPAPAEQPADLSAADQQATQSLTSAWQQVLALVRKENPNIASLMSSSKRQSMRGDRVILGFASDILKAKMEKPEVLETAQRVISQLFQRPVKVLCQVDTGKGGNLPSEVDGEGIVAAALRDLGGELVDFS